MSFVQRGVDMVNERLNRVKGSPEQKPAEFPAEVPLTIDEGRGPAPSLPSTSSSLPTAGDARGVLGVPGGAPTRSESPPLMQDADPGVPAQSRPPSIPLSSIPLVASEIDDAHGPSADEIHGLDDMLWLLREPGVRAPSRPARRSHNRAVLAFYSRDRRACAGGGDAHG